MNRVEGPTRELGVDPAADPTAQAQDSIARFLRFHPLMTFFVWLADRQYGDVKDPAVRVKTLRGTDQRFYWFCVIVDALITALAVLLILGAATIILWNSLIGPFPDPFASVPASTPGAG